MKAEASRK